DGDRNRVRRDLFAVLDEEVVVLALADVDAAAAAANHDAGARLADLQVRVAPRFARGDHGDQRRARITFRIGAISGIPNIVALERRHVVDRDVGRRRRDTTGEIRDVKIGDGARAAAAAADVFPEAFAPHAERRDDADAADD